QLLLHERNERLGHCVTVGVAFIRYQPTAERVRARNTCFECGVGAGGRWMRRKALQPFEFFDDAQAARSGELPNYFMPAALVMSRRSKTAQWRAFEFNAFQIAIKRQIKVEPCLLAVRDDVQPGGDLVVNRRNNRVFL